LFSSFTKRPKKEKEKPLENFISVFEVEFCKHFAPRRKEKRRKEKLHSVLKFGGS
jgi:hypothetical protein